MSNDRDILDQCQRIGIEIDQLIVDGAWHRCRVTGKRKSNRDGAYCLNELLLRNGDRAIVGVAHNWHAGEQMLFTLDAIKDTLSDDDRKAAQAEMERTRKAAEKARQDLAEETAQRAHSIFEKLPAGGQSDYLNRKKIKPHGIKFSRGSIVVPVRDAVGKIWGLQFISPDGSKKFLTGTAKAGKFHLFGDVAKASVLLVAEGYATAATLHEATGYPVAVAFDADNMTKVAPVLRAMFPELPMVICGDDDTETDGNPGRTKAEQAASAVGGVAVFPVFKGAA